VSLTSVSGFFAKQCFCEMITFGWRYPVWRLNFLKNCVVVSLAITAILLAPRTDAEYKSFIKIRDTRDRHTEVNRQSKTTKPLYQQQLSKCYYWSKRNFRTLLDSLSECAVTGEAYGQRLALELGISVTDRWYIKFSPSALTRARLRWAFAGVAKSAINKKSELMLTRRATASV